MKINVEYFENEINILNDKVCVFEIENKKYFYRFISDLYNISNENEVEEIKFFDGTFQEINLSGEIQVITNYFDFEFESKKYTTAISKYINKNITEEGRQELLIKFKKLEENYKKIINKLDLSLTTDQEFDITVLTKMLKVKINDKKEIVDNLFTLIDVEKELRINKLLVFINLKQYLTKEELNELYKYSLYNDVKIVLVDSQCYGVTNDYEKKMIIDSNLEELVI